MPRRSSILVLGLILSVAFSTGCQKSIDTNDPIQLRAAAQVVLLPHVTDERRTEILGFVEGAGLPDSVTVPALSGIPDEEARAGRIVLSQVGASQPDVASRVEALSRLVNGLTERPMGAGELQKIEPWVEARMYWAVVDGRLILARDGAEVDQLTGGLNLSKSSGLTRHGAEMVRGMVNPVLDLWKTAPVQGFSADIRYIAALFGARESVEAAVVIFSVLTAIGLAGTGRVRAGKVATGILAAVGLAIATGFVWNALIKAGSLGGGKQTVFIIFGVASIAMFLLIGSAVFHPVYFGRWMSNLRTIGRGSAGKAAFLVSFLAVYREGFEMSLSMTTLSMIGGWGAVTQGLFVGIPAGLVMVALGYKIQRGWVGVRGMLVASGAMMMVAAASFSALFVNYLEQQGVISPIYISKNIPVAVTVFTGLSGSLQTLVTFLVVAGALVAPWILRRARHTWGGGYSADAGSGGWAGAGKTGFMVAILAAVGYLTQPGVKPPELVSVETVSLAAALASAEAGTAVLVDSRDAGSTPVLEKSFSLPMDNDDESIREFCKFVGENKEILVYGEIGKNDVMARRILEICGKKAKSVVDDKKTPRS